MYRLFIKSIFIWMTLIVAIVLGISVAFSADFQKGYRAFQQGDYETAFNEWLPLAEQGNSTAQYILGLMYDNGEGVSQDYVEAVKWYQKAAEQGNASAQFSLGVMYSNGEGVPQDDKEAVIWYHKAAKQGDASAQYNLGVMYGNGQGVLQDYVVAYMWYNLAASLGNKLGQKNRNIIAKDMTHSQIAEAQNLAKKCFASNYKNC